MATLRVEAELDVPEHVLAELGNAEATAAWARQALVLHLLREAKISQGWAARLLGITRGDIIDLMAKYQVESGPETPEELCQEIENAERFVIRREAHARHQQ